MTGVDWLIIAVLAGAVVLTICVDGIRRLDEKQADRIDRQASHDRLLDELWRQP